MLLINKDITLTIRPRGAKIVSLKYKGVELLFIPDNSEYLPKPGDTFDEKCGWGGDICAPTVSKCDFLVNGYKMRSGDHGDFWTTDFKLKSKSKNSITLVGKSREFELTVMFKLLNDKLIRKYTVKNITKYKLPFTFADHLILPVQKDIKPEKYLDLNTKKLTVWWSYDDKLGRQGSLVKWPVKRQRPFADKLFSKLRKKKGAYAVGYNRYNSYNDYNNYTYIALSSNELPFLGYWQTEGGWPHFVPPSGTSRGVDGEYNLGLELTNTDADDLSVAVSHNTVWWLSRGKKKTWSVELKVTSVSQ